ncbi:MAG: MYG1 family protein [Patescibacteria group bacterium]
MKEIKIATHNQHFHPDDVFAVAALSALIKEPFKVIRTRNPLIIKNADYVVDVGGEYDEEKNRFDHHQKGGAGERANGIPYASFGLVWKKYGGEISGSDEVAKMIERKIVESTDASDNGVGLIKPMLDGVYPYSYFNVVSSLNPTWKEKDKNYDERFMKVVESAKEILLREIEIAKHFLLGKGFVEKAYNESPDKRLVILDNEYSWKEIVNKYNEPLFVIEPNFEEGSWRIAAVRDDIYSFKNRKDLPESWGGKRGEELASETGVSDAFFCHRNLFIAAAHSRDGAIKMAKMAIER